MSEAQTKIMVSHVSGGIINTKIDIAEIKFMESNWSKDKNRIIVYTTKGDYYTSGSLSQWASFIISAGQDFMKGDRNVLINISQIENLDCNYRKAYFYNDDQECLLSEKAFNIIAKKLGIVVVKIKESLVW